MLLPQQNIGGMNFGCNDRLDKDRINYDKDLLKSIIMIMAY